MFMLTMMILKVRVCNSKKLLKRNVSSIDLNTGRNDRDADAGYSGHHAPPQHRRPQSLDRWASQNLHDSFDHEHEYYNYSDQDWHHNYDEYHHDRYRYRDYRDASPSYYGARMPRRDRFYSGGGRQLQRSHSAHTFRSRPPPPHHHYPPPAPHYQNYNQFCDYDNAYDYSLPPHSSRNYHWQAEPCDMTPPHRCDTGDSTFYLKLVKIYHPQDCPLKDLREDIIRERPVKMSQLMKKSNHLAYHQNPWVFL